MGNCLSSKGFRQADEIVEVATTASGIMQFKAPITPECITNEFPGHAIFRSSDPFSGPLLHNEELHPGELYYLLPLQSFRGSISATSRPSYRISLDHQGMMLGKAGPEVLPRYNSAGVWKVKLLISPEQLTEILSQDAHTEALIESLRTVAKSGHVAGNGASSVADSEYCSLSQS